MLLYAVILIGLICFSRVIFSKTVTRKFKWLDKWLDEPFVAPSRRFFFYSTLLVCSFVFLGMFRKIRNVTEERDACVSSHMQCRLEESLWRGVIVERDMFDKKMLENRAYVDSCMNGSTDIKKLRHCQSTNPTIGAPPK